MRFFENFKHLPAIVKAVTVISLAAALGILVILALIVTGVGDSRALTIGNSALMLVVSVCCLIKVWKIDQQRSLIIIWGLASLIFAVSLAMSIAVF